MEEVWKDIVGYEGIYKVSNIGNVKSLIHYKERILKTNIDAHGYLKINLRINGIQKTKKVHQLVAEAFLNHKPCGWKLVVNHIDFNKLNNSVDNLEIVTQRENANLKHIKSSSQFVGVTWVKQRKNWRAQIQINGKAKTIGGFKDELEASNAYQRVLKEIEERAENLKQEIANVGF